MTFHEHLIFLRKQKGLSQEQLGAEIGVTRQTVSKWELGETTPEMDKLIRMSELFGISMDALVGREGVNQENQNNQNNIPQTVFMYRWHYEYKSKRTLFGVPLVHVNVGHGIYRAKGILAVGNIAKGIISVGAISTGILSLGSLSLGVLSLGAVSFGALLSIGGISVGTVALGGLAIGILAMGGCAIGTYALGGCAIAEKIASGGYANASIAIGEKAVGQYSFYSHETEAIRKAIFEKYPGTWQIIVDLFGLFS